MAKVGKSQFLSSKKSKEKTSANMFSLSFNMATVSGYRNSSMEQQSSNKFGAERLHALQKLEEILHQKEMEITSLQLQNLPAVEQLKGSAGSSNEYEPIDVMLKEEEERMQRMRINNGQKMSGRKALQVGEAKQQLHERLKRLEEENESMKKEFFEHLEESKKLMNEICQAISHNTSFASARIMSCE